MSTRRNDENIERRNQTIRHHLEEASTHIAMVKQLMKDPPDQLTTVGKYLKRLYIRHGGIDH